MLQRLNKWNATADRCLEMQIQSFARRELYRRCSQLGETVVDVAERVVYAVMKES